jgi:hypothetical protein
MEPAALSSDRTATLPSVENSPTDDHFRVAAFPADYALTNDVILRDETGRAYLLSQNDDELLAIGEDTANSLGMFFEPSQDSSWHTVSELRRIIYGLEDTIVSIR